MDTPDDLRDWLRLHLAGGVGAVLERRLVDAFAGPANVARADRKALLRVEGIGPKTAEAILNVDDQAIDRELELIERFGVRVLLIDDDRYPKPLRMIPTPPQLLYVRGRLRETDAVALGVVGSRNSTHYGLEQSQRFGELLAGAGFTVVSGGARGIDTAGHRGALAAGGRTIAVMGCGLAHVYPRENRKLFERIVAEDRGALVSELPMSTAPESKNFPRRNRIISGLSMGVLVVEAARRSGALRTARIAIEDHNRDVLAVPGPVNSPTSQGTNELIRKGQAGLVQSLDDVLEQLGEVGDKLAGQRRQAEGSYQSESLPAPPGLDDTEQAVFDALAQAERGLDELVRRTGLDSGRLVSTLTMLVLKGAVEQRPGNVFARKRRSVR